MAAPAIGTLDSALLDSRPAIALAYPCELRSRAAILGAFGPTGVNRVGGAARSSLAKWPMILGARPAGI